ncbi:MAG: HAD family hydrolase [Gammaproteobacteria bacterium]|nr:HAD family hydrolase [Gammaproteobacteria bacterium]MDH3380865.1 HAD family hydrolase [Gammaproteobacteria bacterium]
MKSIAAITLDLDDTLWPIEPVIRQAEQNVYAWLARQCPRVTQQYGMKAMRRMRKQVAAENPSLKHDLTAIRRLALERMFVSCDYPLKYVEDAYAVFIEARNQVQPFPDVLPTLNALHGQWPMVTISNGNADLEQIGISAFFEHSVCARAVGAAKPHPDVFLSACDKLGLKPEQILHIGDHPQEDIVGAANVGMKTVWLNRQRNTWRLDQRPDAQISSLSEVLSLIGDTVLEIPAAQQ